MLLAVALAVLAQADGGLDAGVPGSRVIVRAPDGGLPPAGLSCLPTWYAGTVKYKADAGGWGIELETGLFLDWGSPDGGAHVDPDDPDSEEIPDLADIYDPPYVSGPIVPLDVSDAGSIVDPGRARVEQLFLATYGSKRDEVQERLGRVRFFGLRYPFHERAAEALRRVVARLEPQVKANPKLLPFLKDIGGTWIWRTIKRSKRLSAHAFGIAIDLNVELSNYWRWTYRGHPMVWKNRVPQEIVDAFEAEGFIWGGRWIHFDTMHFEYRPELLSPLCRE
ncbi:MAG: M15 family metallopeptidase [Myxococcaceae bacterium]